MVVCYCSITKLVPTDTVNYIFRHIKLHTGMSMHTGVHYRNNGHSNALTKLCFLSFLGTEIGYIGQLLLQV